jgi:hypothetical protein
MVCLTVATAWYSGIETMMEHQLQYFLDRFYISRIAIRMLINQHTILFGKERPDGHDRHIGGEFHNQGDVNSGLLNG